jgi:hypothetical protein
MARWLKTDGTEQALQPGGGSWTLKELQDAVGGPIELMPGVAPLRLILHEEGRLLGLPINPVATALLHQALADQMQIAVEDLPATVGTRLRYLPELRGNVLVLETGDRL